MSTQPLPFLEILNPARAPEIPVAWLAGTAAGGASSFVHLGEFRRAALALAATLAAHPARNWALCCEDAALHAAAFLAALHAGKNIVLPGHNRPALLAEQHAAGDFDALLLDTPNTTGVEAVPVPPFATGDAGDAAAGAAVPVPDTAGTVTFFTSGSTGVPKRVVKTLDQLQIENDLHAAHWGQKLPGALTVGTTAHAHLYGLQFRVLLPLTLGVPFNARLLEYHEQLLALPAPFALITSPAFLKRLDAKFAPPAPPHECRFILSAGGFLPPETAAGAAKILGVAPFEIFGSTEAGAMAWRDTGVETERWRPLPGVRCEAGEDGRLSLRSPFLAGDETLVTDDRIEFDATGAFRLLGRLDRVVKIEEKRVSLPDVEARLRALGDLVADAAVVPLRDGSRTVLGAVLALTAAGAERRASLGSGRFLLEVRARLRPVLEPVAIPRRIRVLPRVPETTQGKRDTAALAALFEPLLPRELGVARSAGDATGGDAAAVTLDLELTPDLLWFRGHFPARALLPGVAQLRWAAHYGAALLAPGRVFAGIEALKFQKPLASGDRIALALRWDAARERLSFAYTLAGAAVSSGKIILRQP
ncbi:MAG: AMP-binding protein [Puniceicoccales bacterium]|jgi:acyl-coenzyme A synthetase/AMP-(fatty) acid ligase/3-hydroxymyristoyl/3-hydroxydecanoyl-(acyl carrier protein) dehydratase|nr:AMP-binding protein [Puniceicoccales bacterium]